MKLFVFGRENIMADAQRKDTSEQGKFREYCREWLAKNHPGEPGIRLPQSPLEIMTKEQMDYLQQWEKSAYDASLVGCDYPEQVGGGGRKGANPQVWPL